MEENKEKTCTHENYRYLNRYPQADGTEDIIFIDFICKNCDKKLVTREKCVSATWTHVYDKEWGEIHGYK